MNRPQCSKVSLALIKRYITNAVTSKPIKIKTKEGIIPENNPNETPKL
jgi:hypothetical protein